MRLTQKRNKNEKKKSEREKNEAGYTHTLRVSVGEKHRKTIVEAIQAAT